MLNENKENKQMVGDKISSLLKTANTVFGCLRYGIIFNTSASYPV